MFLYLTHEDLVLIDDELSKRQEAIEAECVDLPPHEARERMARHEQIDAARARARQTAASDGG